MSDCLLQPRCAIMYQSLDVNLRRLQSFLWLGSFANALCNIFKTNIVKIYNALTSVETLFVLKFVQKERRQWVFFIYSCEIAAHARQIYCLQLNISVHDTRSLSFKVRMKWRYYFLPRFLHISVQRNETVWAAS